MANNAETVIAFRVEGGIVGSASTLAPKIGPLGLNPKKTGDDIAKATKEWLGQKITVRLVIKQRKATVFVVPSAAALLIRELGIHEPAEDEFVSHAQDITMEQIYSCAKVMRERSMAREFSGTVREILGTARSLACTVDGKTPQSWIEAIKAGEHVCPDFD